MEYHFSSIILVKIENVTTLSVGKSVGQWAFSYTTGDKVNLCNLFKRQSSNIYPNINLYALHSKNTALKIQKAQL